MGDGVMELGGYSMVWVFDGHAYACQVGTSPRTRNGIVGMEPWLELDHLIPAELRGDPGQDDSGGRGDAKSNSS